MIFLCNNICFLFVFTIVCGALCVACVKCNDYSTKVYGDFSIARLPDCTIHRINTRVARGGAGEFKKFS